MMRKTMIKAMLLAGLSLAPVAVQAQNQGAIAGRVDRLESEMRAVQRKVFPGGSGQYVQPDNGPPPSDTVVPGSPSNSPVADLNARVDALESRLTSLTGQAEVTGHRLQVLEDAFNAYKRTTDARLKALEDGASATAAPPPAEGNPRPTRPTGSAGTPARPGATGTPPPAKPGAAKPTKADPERSARLAAIEKPSTGDAGEDEYLYGFRLYQAKLYPEAETQLKLVVSKYPKHKRASYAQNLLGRSYLDESKPSLAALAFYESYKKFPDGDRAPDSLMNLAESLRALNKPAADICQVYDEVQKYGPRLTAKMKTDLAAGRAQSQCR